ncbi:phosphoribosylglycinamide formyltransferase [Virgibacillus sp. NKC19-3]|uniref:phosphoribosylglycinamide formyltransferase n=1 Tax=Virgibacillus saliphilus TaxID=2831674 RepID=UPI001C9B8B34|nr:phosphoribosylglycinamide formyltransferase [Virgibacillus sp. NKC19-3]MBY7142670.1 phosphoribosylglycinamide formyltransferase [Virgibacillus sp. NKC19-3]
MPNVKAAVFASGTGSNFQAMIEADLACDIVLLVCDKPGAAVLDRAGLSGVSTFVFDPRAFTSKAEYEAKIIEKLYETGVTWIFLAGYMRIIGATLLEAFEGKIINIHPSLLPAFPGKDAIKAAYNAGVGKTGVSVHFIDEGMDTGPVIAQESVKIFPNDTIQTLQVRLQQLEHRLYPRVINQLILSK